MVLSVASRYIYAVSRRSHRKLLAVAVCLVAWLVMLGPAAHAACTDTAGPGVEWERCYLDNRRFMGVDLTGAKLRGAFLARTDFSGADFTEVDGRRAKFVTATLVGTTWDRARLIGADFTKSDLTDASFQEADLRRARFFRAVLRGADFTNARLDGTDFLRADLSGARWTDGETICSDGSIGQCN